MICKLQTVRAEYKRHQKEHKVIDQFQVRTNKLLSKHGLTLHFVYVYSFFPEKCYVRKIPLPKSIKFKNCFVDNKITYVAEGAICMLHLNLLTISSQLVFSLVAL